MKGVLADINVQSHVDSLVGRMRVEPWKLFWDHLELRYFHFAEIGLAPDAPDPLVWDTCQKEDPGQLHRKFLLYDHRDWRQRRPSE